jgi:hypothetical protein
MHAHRRKKKRKEKEETAMTRSFLEGRAPNYGPNLVKEIMARYPSVFLIVMRAKNQNVMIYEANIVDGKFDPENPVDIYWLNLETSYREARSDRDIYHDREEINVFERNMVWGAESSLVSDREIKFHMKIDSHPMRVKLSPCKADGKTKANLFTVWNSEGFLLRSCYVASTENLLLTDLRDNLKELVFNGISTKTKKSVTVSIDPKTRQAAKAQ